MVGRLGTEVNDFHQDHMATAAKPTVLSTFKANGFQQRARGEEMIRQNVHGPLFVFEILPHKKNALTQCALLSSISYMLSFSSTLRQSSAPHTMLQKPRSILPLTLCSANAKMKNGHHLVPKRFHVSFAKLHH